MFYIINLKKYENKTPITHAIISHTTIRGYVAQRRRHHRPKRASDSNGKRKETNQREIATILNFSFHVCPV